MRLLDAGELGRALTQAAARIHPCIYIHAYRHHRRSGHKTLTIDGREVHRAQNAVDAGEIVAFEVSHGGGFVGWMDAVCVRTSRTCL